MKNRLPFLILLILLFTGLGCGAVKSTYKLGQRTAKSLTNRLRPGEDPILKKRIFLPQLIDQAGISKGGVAQTTDHLIALLQKESNLTVKALSGSMPVSDNINSPQYGVIIEPSLIKKAEEAGADVLLLGIINPLESTVKLTGIWPLRKVKREIEISVALNALKITNSTLFLTNLETRKIKIEEAELEAQDSKTIDFRYLAEPLYDIMEDHADELIDELNRQAWEGKIAFTPDGRLRISGGSDIGIVKDQIFEVFGDGEIIIAADGREFQTRGKKVGELRAGSVMWDYTIMVPFDGKNFKEGQIVKVKR